MRNRIYILVALLALGLAACQREVAVGDIYRDGSLKGIVVELDSEGHPTMLLSLEEASGLCADTALMWADALNQNGEEVQWVLPDYEQMNIVAQHKVEINAAAASRGEAKVLPNRSWYWTSTPCANEFCPSCPVTHVYALGPDGLRCYFKENHSALYRARAVLVLR